MKTQVKITFLVLILIMVICSGFYSVFVDNGMDLESGSGTNIDNTPIPTEGLESRSHQARLPTRIKDPRIKRVFDTTMYTDNLINSSQIEKYFDRVGRNINSVAAIYWLTNDAAYLEELRKYPDSPLALSICSQFDTRDPQRAEENADKLIKLEPENPMGYYLSASWKAARGDVQSAMASLDEVFSRPGTLGNASPQCMKEVRDALNVMGMDDVQSEVYLWTHDNISSASVYIMQDLVRNTLKAGDIVAEETTRAEYASNLLKLCMRNEDMAVSPIAQNNLYRSESLILRTLPEDFEYGENMTVGKRVEEIARLNDMENNLVMRTDSALKSADPITINQYVEITRESGWVAARDWLLGESSK